MGRRDRARPDHVDALTGSLVGGTQVTTRVSAAGRSILDGRGVP